MSTPITGRDFDPLLPPGSGNRVASTQSGFKAGDHVRAVMDNTVFFRQMPKGDADADKLLIRGTRMKVVRVSGSYLQVELDETGEVGFVPSVMAENPNAPQPGSLPGNPGAVQVYPPLPNGAGPLPLPEIPSNALPPDGSVPLVTDPNVPVVPPITPPAASGTPAATPAAPAGTPAATPDPVPPVEPKTDALPPAKPKETETKPKES